MEFSLKSVGDFSKTYKFLESLRKEEYLKVLNEYGRMGVDALSSATPKDSGVTAASWDYKIERRRGRVIIAWTNSNLGDGWFPVALELQYGHATGNGGYVRGRDYINPALRPIFDKMADAAWKAIVEL